MSSGPNGSDKAEGIKGRVITPTQTLSRHRVCHNLEITKNLIVMPDLIPAKDGMCHRHPGVQDTEMAMDYPSTSLRVVSLSNHGTSPE